MPIRTQKGQIYTLQEPKPLKNKPEYAKGYVVVSYKEKIGDKYVTRKLPLEFFGKTSEIDQQWAKFNNEYDEGDKVTAHFDVYGNEWKNSQGETLFFTTAKLIRLEHEDKEEESQQEETLPDEDDGLPF